MKEFELIENIFKNASMASIEGRQDLVLGIGDDCAQVQVPAGQHLVFSMDTLVEGRHFPFDADPAAIGYRAVATCVSDLAAMGAKPAFFTLGLTLPDSDPQWLSAFAQGMAELAEPIGLVLVGGDTTKGPLTISLQVHGYIEPEFAISRAGAKQGDDIYVTGVLGDAAAAVPIMTGEIMVKGDIYEHFYDAYWRPESRLIAAMALKRVVSSMLDVSDGLVQDIHHILKASSVGAQIDAGLIPVSEALLQWQPDSALTLALTGGDDYELCFTAPESAREEIALITQTLHLPCKKIGQITDSGFVVEGYEGEFEGWQHF
ncbi:Putative thiamin-monophosphate kinase [Marinomonas sp. MED121]|uniref:thiamine-phosphate kinase n=1 Tax=Marinomonas sp. MED121 TaxID=314277 RepID=UPI0000690EF5|nr:thiamine-phosphate kinase [Marinomonas sp. MED121]EAQ64258.1 Putative thiamin-monophosphate kinase [Marinomonas sp. MED121]